MTIAFTDQSSKTIDGTSGFNPTWAHTVTAASGKQQTLLVALVVTNNTGGDASYTGVTYNGVALSKIADSDVLEGTARERIEIWHLPNPPVGTFNIVATGANSTSGNYQTVTGQGETVNSDSVLMFAEQTEFSTAVDTSGTTTQTVALTTLAANALLVDWYAANFNQTQTADTGQTEIVNIPNAGTRPHRLSHSYKAVSTASANTMGWSTAAVFRRVHVATAIYESAGVGAPDLTASRVYQRTSRAAGSGPVNLTAFTSLTNGAASLEARVMKSGTVVQDWTAATGFTLAKSRVNATMTVPVGSGYNIEVRLKKSDGSIIGSVAKTNVWHMGSVYCFAGSSTMERSYNSGTSNTLPSGMVASIYFLGSNSTTIGTKLDWTNLTTARDGLFGFFSTMNQREPGVPVGVLNYGFAGSTLKGWETPDNVNDNFLAATTAIKAFGAEATCFTLGANDTTLVFASADVAMVTQADFEARYRSLLSKFRTAIGIANHPIYLQGIQASPGLSSNPIESDRRYSLVRSAITAVSNDTNNYHGATAYNLPIGSDNIHLDGLSMQTFFSRLAVSITTTNGAFSSGEGIRGPKPLSMSYDSASGWAKITFSRSRGTSLVGTMGQTGLSGFAFSSNGNPVYTKSPQGVFVSGTNEVSAQLDSGLTNVGVNIETGRVPNKMNMLSDNSTINPVVYTALTAPTGLSVPPPFNIYRGTDGTYKHDFDATTRRFSTNLTYYAGAGGDDNNDGLTWATRFRSLTKLLAAARARAGSAGATQLYAQTGVYRKSDGTGFVLSPGVAQSIALNMKFNLEPCDASGNPIVVDTTTTKRSKANQIIVYHDVVMPAFVATSDPNVYVCSYTNELPGKGMFDEKYKNRFGRPLGLRNVPIDQVADVTNPIAEVNKMADVWKNWAALDTRWGLETKKGAFFLDRVNKKLWVRMSDDRAPDSQLIVTGTSNVWYLAVNQNSTTTGHYIRGVDFMGGTIRENGWPASSLWNRTFTDVYCGSNEEGAFLSSAAGTVAWQRCYGSDIGVDFIGTGTESGETATIVGYELDCEADFVGMNGPAGNGGGGDTSSNAFTEHSLSRVVRVNLVYRFFHNRGIHDIGDAQVWMCGITAGPSTIFSDAVSGFVSPLTTDQKNTSVAVACGYHQNTDPQTTKCWLDGLFTVGPMQWSMGAYNNVTDSTTGGTLLYRNVMSGATNVFTIDHPATGNTAKGKIGTY